MNTFMRAISATLTATAICIGNCWGMTLVMIITHFSRSSCVVFSFFSKPTFITYAALMSAKTSKISSAMPVSRMSPCTLCCENSIICMSAPWLDAKPVRRTYATQPLLGGGGMWGMASAVLVSFSVTRHVPEKRT